MALYQCVPNFSEGRRPETVAAFVAAARAAGALVIDHSMDPDHNRSVITLLGDAGAIHAAVTAMAAVAVESIDLRTHTGVHPRTGAIDVTPIIPIRAASMQEADALAHDIGRSLAAQLALPVFYYERSVKRRVPLPQLRRMLAAYPQGASLSGEFQPDEGPARAHPTAGVAIVGARGQLVAYNINFASQDLQMVRQTAKCIREDRDANPALTGVRALGLYLPTRESVQVSMNLTMPESTPLPPIWRYVNAASHGIETAESEIIGVIPASSLDGASPADIAWRDFAPTKILDTWLEAYDDAGAQATNSPPQS